LKAYSILLLGQLSKLERLALFIALCHEAFLASFYFSYS